MFIRFVISTWVIWVLLAFCTAAESPNLRDLETGIGEHLRSYDGLEFSITSSLFQEDGSGKKTVSSPELRETVRLHFPEKGHAWKYWVQEVQDKLDGQWIVNSFKVTDVVKTHNFTFLEDTWSSGNVTPGHQWYEEQYGRHFFTFLGLDTVGLSLLRFNVSDEIWNKSVARFNLQFEKEERLGDQKQWVFQGSGEDIRLCVLYPQNMVVHWEVFDGKESMMSYIVEEVGIFEGICYPRKGKHHQSLVGPGEKIDYNFEVTGVRRFEPELLQNWFPEWPSGTIVHDVATDSTTRIPFTERQRKNMEETLSYEITPQSTWWIILRVITIIIGAALILYGLYRMLEKSKR